MLIVRHYYLSTLCSAHLLLYALGVYVNGIMIWKCFYFVFVFYSLLLLMNLLKVGVVWSQPQKQNFSDKSHRAQSNIPVKSLSQHAHSQGI